MLLLIVLCLPLFIDANQLNPTIETKLNAERGRTCDIRLPPGSTISPTIARRP